MKDFLTTYQGEIITASISFIVALFTTLLTHFMGNFKLRYTEKLKITSELSKRKYEGITKIREGIRVLLEYEDLTITEKDNFSIIENSRKIYTPACCYSYKDLFNVGKILNNLYREYSDCLRDTSVIYLVYIRNFLLDYGLKCRESRFSDEELRKISVPLYNGMVKWYKKFDKELIRSMNKPSMKYFSHSGLKYNFLLKIYGFYFEKLTTPYKYMNDKNSLLNKTIIERETNLF